MTIIKRIGITWTFLISFTYGRKWDF